MRTSCATPAANPAQTADASADGVRGDIAATLRDASLVIFAAPSHAARELLSAMAPSLEEAAIVVSVSKGIEIESGKRNPTLDVVEKIAKALGVSPANLIDEEFEKERPNGR